MYCLRNNSETSVDETVRSLEEQGFKKEEGQKGYHGILSGDIRAIYDPNNNVFIFPDSSIIHTDETYRIIKGLRRIIKDFEPSYVPVNGNSNGALFSSTRAVIISQLTEIVEKEERARLPDNL